MVEEVKRELECFLDGQGARNQHGSLKSKWCTRAQQLDVDDLNLHENQAQLKPGASAVRAAEPSLSPSDVPSLSIHLTSNLATPWHENSTGRSRASATPACSMRTKRTKLRSHPRRRPLHSADDRSRRALPFEPYVQELDTLDIRRRFGKPPHRGHRRRAVCSPNAACGRAHVPCCPLQAVVFPGEYQGTAWEVGISPLSHTRVVHVERSGRLAPVQKRLLLHFVMPCSPVFSRRCKFDPNPKP